MGEHVPVTVTKLIRGEVPSLTVKNKQEVEFFYLLLLFHLLILFHLLLIKSVNMLDTIVNTKYKYKYVVSSLLCFVGYTMSIYFYWFSSYYTPQEATTVDAPFAIDAP